MTGVQTCALPILDKGEVSALVVLGEDPLALGGRGADTLKGLKYLGALDIMMTDTAANADTLLPMVSFAETWGSYTRSDGKVQVVNKGLKPLTGKTNLDVLLLIGSYIGLNFKTIEDVRENIAREIDGYKAINGGALETQKVSGPHMEYSLKVPTDGPGFKESLVYDSVERQFSSYAKANGISY